MMLACESDSVETVAALLRGGASTQLVDQLGHKAVDFATTTGNQGIVRMLQDGVPPGTGPWAFFVGYFGSLLLLESLFFHTKPLD